MAVSGCPEADPLHALRMADFALAAVEAIDRVKRQCNVPHLQIRVGLNSGPLVAGVIRSSKKRFQLFGGKETTLLLGEGLYLIGARALLWPGRSWPRAAPDTPRFPISMQIRSTRRVAWRAPVSPAGSRSAAARRCCCRPTVTTSSSTGEPLRPRQAGGGGAAGAKGGGRWAPASLAGSWALPLPPSAGTLCRHCRLRRGPLPSSSPGQGIDGHVFPGAAAARGGPRPVPPFPLHWQQRQQLGEF